MSDLSESPDGTAEGAAPTPGPVRHHYTIGHGRQESASATPGRRESRRAVRYIGSMDPSTSVEGCTSCGALYTPDPGDQGVCSMCRSLLPAQPAARTSGTSSRPMSGSVSKGPGAMRRISLGRRALRRIAIGAGSALLVAGLGAWWMRSSGHTPSTHGPPSGATLLPMLGAASSATRRKHGSPSAATPRMPGSPSGATRRSMCRTPNPAGRLRRRLHRTPWFETRRQRAERTGARVPASRAIGSS